MILGTRAGYHQLSGLGLNVFTDDELAELHRSTLDVLDETGIMVLNEEAREVFYSNGCEVDKKSNIVKIPSYLVEEAIASAPDRVLLAARDPKYDVVARDILQALEQSPEIDELKWKALNELGELQLNATSRNYFLTASQKTREK